MLRLAGVGLELLFLAVPVHKEQGARGLDVVALAHLADVVVERERHAGLLAWLLERGDDVLE